MLYLLSTLKYKDLEIVQLINREMGHENLYGTWNNKSHFIRCVRVKIPWAFSWAYSKWCITSVCVQSSGRIIYMFVRQPALFKNAEIQKAIQNPFLHFCTCLFSWNPMNPEYSESENDSEKLKVCLSYHVTKY